MPRQPSKYFWPASGISESDMDLLFRAREQSLPRVPITRLLAKAVRHAYGHLAVDVTPEPIALKEAA
jgi:hypothetical protein